MLETDAEMAAWSSAPLKESPRPNRVTRRVLADVMAGRNVARYTSIEALAAAAGLEVQPFELEDGRDSRYWLSIRFTSRPSPDPDSDRARGAPLRRQAHDRTKANRRYKPTGSRP